jgi:hypothetical protein
MRWLFRSLIVAAVGGGLIVAAALLVNRPPFDDPLLVELEALKSAEPPGLEQNGYPIAMGFLAANNADPESAGRAILAALSDRYKAGQRIAIAPEDRRKLLGTDGPETWQSPFESLECVPRVDLDCADRLIAEVAHANLDDARFTTLASRFDNLIQQPHLDEGQQRDAYTPFAPFGAIRNVSRVLLARSFSKDTDAAFIARAAEQLRFWRVMLREGQTLVAKMIAVAGIQDTLDFLSALMRERELAPADAGSIGAFVSALTPQELDIGNGFVSEARIQVLNDALPLASDASAFDRILLLRHATLNDYYSSIIHPLLLRARLSPAEFHRTGGNRALDFSKGVAAPLLSNLGGYRLIRDMKWDPEQFIARTQDQNGRLLLVMLQAELEQASGAARQASIASSSHRNPYTGEPMHYDERTQTIGFQCLHTAYHPPALPDQCAVRLGNPGSARP